jgi:hypothetical protein
MHGRLARFCFGLRVVHRHIQVNPPKSMIPPMTCRQSVLHRLVRTAILLLVGFSLFGVERPAFGTVAGTGTVSGTVLRILRQPEAVTAGSGGNVLLSVNVRGEGPLVYQWRKDGIPLSGAVSPVLELSDLLEADAGTYTVDVGNWEQSLSSAGALVSVLTGAPVVLAQTPSRSVVPGTTQLLRVFVRAAASVTYQWRKGGVPIPGATGASHVLASVQVSDAGRYDVLLKNEFGTVQSMPVVLGVAAEARQDFQSMGYRWVNLGEMLSGTGDSGENSATPLDVCDLALDSAGNLFFVDTYSHVIRKITPGGVVTMVAGRSGEAGAADGAGAVARFDSPQGIALDEAGNLFVADTGNNTVRKVTPQGEVSTVAGQAGDFGIAGEMLAPRKVAVDRSGTVYVLDNETVRKVVADRRTAVVFGGEQAGDSDFPPYPTALEVDSAGRLYVAAIDAGVSKLLVRGSTGAFVEAAFGDTAAGETGAVALGDLALGDGRRLYALSELGASALYFGEIGTTAWGAQGPRSLFGESQSTVLPRALAVDAAGTVYLADSLTQSFLVGVPEGVPAFSEQPAGGAFKIGEPFALRAEIEGGGEHSYQWFKGAEAIPGATGPVWSVGRAEASDSAAYRVEVSNHAGRVTSFAAVVVVVPAGPSLLVLRQPGNAGAPGSPVRFLKGTAASVRVALDPAGAETLGTEYSVYSYANGALGLPVGISGMVPANGELTLPLRSLSTSGAYLVRFTRRFPDGTLQVNSEPFVVEVQGMEVVSGSYEVLLRDASGGLLEDGAFHRGVLLVTVSKTGAVSGRVLYNEAPRLQGAEPGIRAYTCVSRSFSSALAPSAEDPMKMVCRPKLGVGSSANRQRLQIEFDLSGASAELNATLTDTASTSESGGCVSQGSGGLRSLSKLSDPKAAGRYVLSADGGYSELSPAENNLAQVFVQVLATGRVLWATSLAGYTGTGSAGLAAADSATLVAQFYEGRSLSGSKSLATHSLLGLLKFSKSDESTWGAAFGGDTTEGSLERQATYLTRDSTRALVYHDEFFATQYSPSSNWSKAGFVLFQAGDGCRWEGSAKDSLAAFLWPEYQPGSVVPATPFYLSAADPLGEEAFVWKVTISSAGVVRASAYPSDAVQPALTLRLDRTRGMWTGSYVYPASRGVRRSLFGASVQAPARPGLRAKGWSQMGALPATRTGSWELLEDEPEAPQLP